MKALVCTSYDGPDGLTIADTGSVTPRGGQVRIRTKATSLNFPDCLIVSGKYQVKPTLPFVPGTEVAGVVSDVGENVNEFKPGDDVYAITGIGGFAEEVTTEAWRVFRMPNGMTYDDAAAFGVVYGTAYYGLVGRAAVKKGEHVLVLGAAGGVGSASLDIAKASGASVIACASTDEKLALCSSRGADACVNYGRDGWREQIDEATHGAGIDVVCDPVGGEMTERALRTLALHGRHLVFGFASGVIPQPPLNLALLKGCSIMGVFLTALMKRDPVYFATQMRELGRLYEQGMIRPLISDVIRLADAPRAMRRMIERRITGKVVMTL